MINAAAFNYLIDQDSTKHRFSWNFVDPPKKKVDVQSTSYKILQFES